jgi:predicted permease
LRRSLVAAQVALSLVLLLGALLFGGSLQKLLTVNPGFRAQGVIAVELDFHEQHYSNQQAAAARREMLERIRSVPGVNSAAEALIWPISGSSWNGVVYSIGGPEIRHDVSFTEAGPGYFRTIGTPLLAGRDFDARDTLTSPKVVIVNQAFARIFFAGANPVGRSFRMPQDPGKPDLVYQIVGLAANSKYRDIREEFLPLGYLPSAQDDRSGFGWDFASFLLHADAPAKDVRSAVKAAVAAVSPGIGVEFFSLSEMIKNSLLRDRLMATLSGAFGLLAALLATLGIYGVMAYTVARRQNEIGIRMALGADRGRVLRLILREASLLLAAGLVIGTGLALWTGQAAGALLYGLKSYDPAALSSAIVLLAAVGLAASYWPARRAARMDPMNALREE